MSAAVRSRITATVVLLAVCLLSMAAVRRASAASSTATGEAHHTVASIALEQAYDRAVLATGCTSTARHPARLKVTALSRSVEWDDDPPDGPARYRAEVRFESFDCVLRKV